MGRREVNTRLALPPQQGKNSTLQYPNLLASREENSQFFFSILGISIFSNLFRISDFGFPAPSGCDYRVLASLR
jgi:hypothetical protein